MQGDKKRGGVSMGVAADSKKHEVENAAAGSGVLQEILEKIVDGTPFSTIRQAYAAPLHILIKLAGRERNVNLLARLHSILSILEADGSGADQRDQLTAQIQQVEEMLPSRAEEPQPAAPEVACRVAELNAINEQLSEECDRIIAANQTLLRNNKNLKTRYAAVSAEHDYEVRNHGALQSRVTAARVESNRLSAEIDFLREEHQKLLDRVGEKHLLLDDLFKRFSGIRASFEFVSGETGFALDLMTNVEGLLNKALMQKQLLHEKIALTEESMEKLFSEFNEIVRKGKMEFYRIR